MQKFKTQRGMILVIILLLTSVLTATGMLLIKVTIAGKQVSENFVLTTKLLNASTVSTEIISQAINDISDELDEQTNIYLVDISGTPTTIVKSPSPSKNIDLYTRLKEKNLVPKTNDSIKESSFEPKTTSVAPTPANPKEAKYTIKINAKTCKEDPKNDRLCQSVDKQIITTRSCPENMRPVFSNELSGLASVNTSYPNLYCTCANSNSKTNADGSCSQHITPPKNASTTGTGELIPGTNYKCINTSYFVCGHNCEPCIFGATTDGSGELIMQGGYDNDKKACYSRTIIAGNSDWVNVVRSGMLQKNWQITSPCYCGTNQYVVPPSWNSPSRCARCTENATCSNQMTNCNSGYYLNNSSCVICPANATCSNNNINCNPGYSLNGNVCTIAACSDGCETCTSATQCTKCQPGYGTDITKANQCTACDSSCATCQFGNNKNFCTTCPANSSYSPAAVTGLGGTTPVVALGGQCTPCPTGSSSNGGTSQCTICDKGYGQQDSNGTGCVKCDSSCATCAFGGRSNSCTSCPINFSYTHIPELLTGTCKKCEIGTFSAGGIVTQCTPCSTGCATCTSASANQCTSCDNDYGLDSAGSACVKCHSSCATCVSGGRSDVCTSCPSGSGYTPILNSLIGGGTCTTCPTGSFSLGGTFQCTEFNLCNPMPNNDIGRALCTPTQRSLLE